MNHHKPHRKNSYFSTLFLATALLSGLGIGAGFYYLSDSPIDEANLPIIREAKEDSCIKVKPNATDNTPVPYSNISIYSELEERSKDPVVEQLLPEPEKPVLETKKEPETIETPPIEVVQVESCKVAEAEAAPAKPRESFNEAMHKTLRNIYNDANTMIVDNVSHGKKMPTIEEPNTNLKIVSQKKPAKETPPATNTPAKNYWVEFKPLSSSKDAEHLWHQLSTHKTAKAVLLGTQHKVQKNSAANGSLSYNLSAGPFSKEAAMACCQRLRQAKINCRVIKK